MPPICIPVTISGKAVNDVNGLSDNTVNGTGTDAGGLNALLIGSDGKVVATATVQPDGSYSFTNIPAGVSYSVAITTNTGTVGQPAPAIVLPTGWSNTGEYKGTGEGNDGAADGILPLGVVDGNVSDANFGIEKKPLNDPVTQNITQPTGGTISAGSITTPISGSDDEDGTYTSGNGHKMVITELPTNGVMTYNGQPVTAGQPIDNFDPALLSFSGLQGGSTSTSFKYTFVDAAGVQGDAAAFTVSWPSPLPIVFGKLDAYFIDGELVINWTTVHEVNADHFDIEISKDGINFSKIGTVKTKAIDGNSTNVIEYSFKTQTIQFSSMIVGMIVLLLLISQIFKRKSLFFGTLTALVLGTVLFISPSCNKSYDQLNNTSKKVFVRVVEVDKQGVTSYSKVLQVNENK